MDSTQKPMSGRERLILAGIAEIRKNGIRSFSMRKTAEACGLSCAAPYKHFKDKQDFILCIIRYINNQWYKTQKELLAALPDDSRTLLREISVAYIRFLVDNPDFRSIIMLTDKNMSAEQVREKAEMSQRTKQLVYRYCDEVGMPDDVREIKTFIVRSLIYGAALMFDNGELEYNHYNLERVKTAIDREFDLD